MKERELSPRPTHEIAPEIVEETDEVVTDMYIDAMLSLGGEHKTLEMLRGCSGECKERLEKLDAMYEDIEGFLKSVSEQITHEDDRKERHMREAVALMLKLHINQPDRVSDGRPYATHPLAVAVYTLDTYDKPDRAYAVMGALLHDTIEDQGRLLALEKRFAKSHDVTLPEQSAEYDERQRALYGIGHIFGLRTQLIVQTLSNPLSLDDDKLLVSKKNEQYLDYVEHIFTDADLTYAPAVIKWGDLQENALTLDKLDERAEQLDTQGAEQEVQRVRAFRDKLRIKYEPVLKIVRTFFTNLDDKEHPLYARREEAIAKIDTALATQYNLA